MIPSEFFGSGFRGYGKLRFTTVDGDVASVSMVMDDVFERAIARGAVFRIEEYVNWIDFDQSKDRDSSFDIYLIPSSEGHTTIISNGRDYGSAMVAWRTKIQTTIWNFDNGSEIKDGSYYCGFSRYEAGIENRTVRVMITDGPRWEFWQKGLPVAGENESEYKRRIIRSRLDYHSLLDIGKRMGYMFDVPSYWQPSNSIVRYKIVDVNLGVTQKVR
jgi:hypothetical protein